MRVRFAVGLFMAGVATGAQAAPFEPGAARARVEQVLSRDLSRLDALYMDIHRHPELAFQEKATAAKLAREMKAAGFTVSEGVGGTGIVAVLKNGAGPTVLVRTELDALPMAERTGLPYASRAVTTWQGRETPVAHSCGHDIHMAAWVGAARALAALKNEWSGTLIFVGQPAEETTSGAQAMLKDDFVRRFGKPDYAFALHVSPAPAGTVLYRSGLMSSTSDSLEIVFHGRGGHGSAPAATIDPVLMAARFTVDVQSVISREKAPEAFGVVTVGAIVAGDAGNVIPDEAVVRGTIRSQDDAVRAKLLAGIRRTAQAVSDMAGAPAATVTIAAGGKMVVNDPALSERTEAVFKQAFGKGAQPFPIVMSGSEDFSEFVNLGVPSVYFLIGGLDPAFFANAIKAGHLPINHSPDFAPEPEPTIATGATAMALAVMNVARPAGR
jgi:hippurate hydrolase